MFIGSLISCLLLFTYQDRHRAFFLQIHPTNIR
jgi:hypothetical protein